MSAGTPDYTDLRYAVDGGVATVTIDRVEVHNALRERTMLELIDALDRADADPEVVVVVLTGAGERAFCTGGDVAMEDAFDSREGRRMARILVRLSEALRGVGKPVIAKIRGWCVGGGNELNLLCDLAIAGESARFAQTDSRLGSSPIWYATQLLPLVVGERRAKEIVLLGEPCSATEAAAMGWINRVVPDAELDDAVAAWCERLLGNSPQAMRLSKTSLNYAGDALMPSVRHGFEALTQHYETAEFHEGTTAFLERRSPRFR